MTPDKRLDQIEPVMADVLQKVDRLIDGQGQIIEIATRADQNANTAAKGVANLTVTTQKQFELLKDGQQELKSNQEGFQAGLEELKSNQEGFQAGLEELKANQQEFKANQDLILQILREKLS